MQAAAGAGPSRRTACWRASAAAGACGAAGVGRAGDRGDGSAGKTTTKEAVAAGAGCAVSGAEVAGQSE